MIITYHAEADMTKPESWKNAAEEIGGYVRKMFLSEAAKDAVKTDRVYASLGEDGIRRCWGDIYAELKADRAAKTVFQTLLEMWSETIETDVLGENTLCRRKNIAISAVFHAENAENGYRLVPGEYPEIFFCGL